MLIRLIVKNLYSFDDYTELNMLPGRFNRLEEHIYHAGGINFLKLNSLYGANGAGKSKLVNALGFLKEFILTGEMPIHFITETFKFSSQSGSKDIYLGIEFVKNDTPYYYGITINSGIIIEEELEISGLDKKEDKLLFRRTDKISEPTLNLVFASEVEQEKDASLFPSFLKNELLTRNKPVLHYMGNRQNKVFEVFKSAFDWFSEDLILILPGSRPTGMALHLESDEGFSQFAKDVLKSFNTGVSDIQVDTIPIEDFFGEDNKQEAERVTAELKANPGKIRPFRTAYEEIVFVLSENRVYAKQLSFIHGDLNNVRFNSEEESDGTRRLIDYLPALYAVINSQKVYVIDEIERSIHPLLIKELIKKFSHDTQTKGQIIFSTHESNLLDQEIFRPDEIWFAEKNGKGATELYPLSEFKEHHTLNIRKGYLNGRYGAIPFLGNLKDLNWEKYAEA